MSSLAAKPETARELPPVADVINNFSIQVATANGSGSQTANTVLMRAICQMGIPVAGKNMFPSNIAGLPTWFTIRASERGYLARKKEIDVLVAMNPETVRDDIVKAPPGAAVVYDEPLKLNVLRNDVHFYPVPFDSLVGPVCPEAKLRKLVRNMIYDGVVAWLVGIEMEEVRAALVKQFGPRKAKAAEMNWKAAQAGFDYAAATFTKTDPFRLERRNLTYKKIILDGNAACALGCVFAGVTVVGWYPITPSTTMIETLIGYMKRLRTDPATGKATYSIIQAEDELAAIGMVLGAGWAGARSMTATSGPGVSLMAEFTGLGYYAELPGVIFDVQRVGPSTGLPTRTAQGDLTEVALLSHGDTKHPIYFPSNPEECFSMAIDAFDLAEEFQTPVFVLTDLDLGMNNWMSDPFPYPEAPIRRGKVLTAEDLERLGEFHRYEDVDGDGVCYRTLPHTNHPSAAYFTRGSGHDSLARYSEKEDDYVANMERLERKFASIGKRVPAPQVELCDGARIGLICCGTSRWATEESRDQLIEEKASPCGYLRIKAFPLGPDVAEFVAAHDRVYVVDQNRDAQLQQLMRLALPGELIARLRSIRHFNGLPIDARSITNEVLKQEGM